MAESRDTGESHKTPWTFLQNTYRGSALLVRDEGMNQAVYLGRNHFE